MKLLSIIIILVLLVPTAMAASFSTDMSELKQNILLDEAAKFELTITNNLGFAEEFGISPANDPIWSVNADPLIAITSEYGLTIADGQSKTVTLYITPAHYIPSGWHALAINIKGKNSGYDQNENARIYIRSSQTLPKDYLPSFTVSVEVPEQQNPRDDLEAKVTLENKNALNIKDMNIKLTSDLFTKNVTTTLEGLRIKTETVKINLDDLQEPGLYEVSAVASMIQENKTYTAKSNKAEFEIVGYSELKRDGNIDKQFLRSTETIIITNDGNVENTGEIKLQTSFFDKLFTKTTPESVLAEDGNKKVLQWEFTLGPQESVELTVKKNYRPIVFALTFLVLVLLLYYLTRPEIVAKKEALRLKTQDNSYSELKVMLHIKNRTGKTLSKVNIIDRIPRIAEVEKEFQMGTLHPSKITKHDKRGTNIYWNIPVLDPYEERIITYRIRSKLTIVGGMKLPNTIIKYKAGRREKAVYSKAKQ